jgi:hypothetical protein
MDSDDYITRGYNWIENPESLKNIKPDDIMGVLSVCRDENFHSLSIRIREILYDFIPKHNDLDAVITMLKRHEYTKLLICGTPSIYQKMYTKCVKLTRVFALCKTLRCYCTMTTVEKFITKGYKLIIN